jgi:hypothetical protein
MTMFKMPTPVDPQLVFETSHLESHYDKQALRDVLEQAAQVAAQTAKLTAYGKGMAVQDCIADAIRAMIGEIK